MARAVRAVTDAVGRVAGGRRPDLLTWLPSITLALFLAEGFRIVAGVLHRLPGHLHEQSFLRVHHLRLARRDVEEARIELVDAVDETAAVTPGESVV